MDMMQLVDTAFQARRRAHAPYSGFAVGAALLTKSGKIFSGCNVENVSFGLTICAERSAVGAAVPNGKKHFIAIAVVAASSDPALPWGACRQVLAEFTPDLPLLEEPTAGV